MLNRKQYIDLASIPVDSRAVDLEPPTFAARCQAHRLKQHAPADQRRTAVEIVHIVGTLIIDRKGSMFKLATGHKVAPVQIEESLKRLSWVDQAQVFGRGRPRPVAIVWVDPKSGPSDEASARQLLESSVRHLDRRSQPERYLMIPRLARIEDDEITITQKLRRAHDERRYAGYFDASPSSEARWIDDCEGAGVAPTKVPWGVRPRPSLLSCLVLACEENSGAQAGEPRTTCE